MTKILGMGNALVDVLVRLESDRTLETFSLPKGSMQLVDSVASQRILAGVAHLDKTITSGGSAANTIHGLARLGMKTGFIGTVGKDKYGDFFRDDMVQNKIDPVLFRSSTETGRAISLISPDSERTFATYLGAAIELEPGMISEQNFRGYDLFHMEGYLVQNHDLVRQAFTLARRGNLKVSLDMASYNVVEENIDFLKEMVNDFVDVVFANEEEAKSFTGQEPEAALHELAGMCEVAVVKTGPLGSLIKRGDEFHRIGVIPVRSIDTTGAGDLYAAAFLFGLVKNLPLKQCGEMGALLSGKVIEVIGPKVEENQWKMIRNKLSHQGYKSDR